MWHFQDWGLQQFPGEEDGSRAWIPWELVHRQTRICDTWGPAGPWGSPCSICEAASEQQPSRSLCTGKRSGMEHGQESWESPVEGQKCWELSGGIRFLRDVPVFPPPQDSPSPKFACVGCPCPGKTTWKCPEVPTTWIAVTPGEPLGSQSSLVCGDTKLPRILEIPHLQGHQVL